MDLKAGATRLMIKELYINQRAQADEHNAQIIGIMQKWLGLTIEVASDEDDMRNNTDLITETGQRIACRVRLHKYWQVFQRQFTIRHSNRSGVETELHKILKGYGDFMFYGFESAAGNLVENWVILDLERFRNYFNGLVAPTVKENKDGENSLAAFNLDAMPAGLVAYSNWYRSAHDARR